MVKKQNLTQLSTNLIKDACFTLSNLYKNSFFIKNPTPLLTVFQTLF